MMQDLPEAGAENRDVIRVVSRTFDILRCFDGPGMRLGNRDVAERCGLPRSTVSRLMLTLTRIGQLAYLPGEQKYVLGPEAIALGAALCGESCDAAVRDRDQQHHTSASIHMAADQLAL